MAGADIEPVAVFFTLAAGVVIKYILSAIVGSRKREYELVGEVASLTCYPIKSCGGFNVESGNCTNLGLQVENGVIDRHWVVSDGSYNMLSSNQMPTLALVRTKCSHGQLILDAPDMPTLTLPASPVVLRSKVVNVVSSSGKTQLEGLDCGEEPASWFSKYLGREGVRLLHSAPGLQKRDITQEKKAWGSPAIAGDQAAYSDFCAYLLMSETSQAAVNEQLQEPLSLQSFRPTIVVKGSRPYDEDEWQSVKIGDNAVLRTLYCTPRCIKVNIDFKTGQRIKENKPLDFLRTIRCVPRFGKSPILGISSALDQGGSVRVGDPVYAMRA
ncbi:mitochondrial amidoxime-reducing component 1-like isoform X1 [Haliotis rufescens]|uniref:mitochondrial amidoxime-reducing component 1-like isoform X1 n=1 Tax=Haliotis rufescens TaxID=6454 RepID=UPI001EAFF9FA|nr:mitochondrial amidoxime-reducing component 1-like isoform X1 [Haliotis rufescens]